MPSNPQVAYHHLMRNVFYSPISINCEAKNKAVLLARLKMPQHGSTRGQSKKKTAVGPRQYVWEAADDADQCCYTPGAVFGNTEAACYYTTSQWEQLNHAPFSPVRCGNVGEAVGRRDNRHSANAWIQRRWRSSGRAGRTLIMRHDRSKPPASRHPPICNCIAVLRGSRYLWNIEQILRREMPQISQRRAAVTSTSLSTINFPHTLSGCPVT